MPSVIAIIPARGNSKRLPRKNILPLCGKPMIAYAITACKKSKHITRVFVSTEDQEIASIARQYDAEVIDRPPALSEDHVWTQEILKQAVLDLEAKQIPVDIVVRVQANSPMVEAEKIDEAIEKLIAQKQRLFEVFSVDGEGYEDAAIHVLLRDTVFQAAFSVYKAVIVTDYLDVHTEEDFRTIEKKWGDTLRARLP